MKSISLMMLVLLATSAIAQSPTPRVVSKPNMDLYVYRRSHTPDEKMTLRLSAYNEQAVDFRVYPLDLVALTPTSAAMEDIGKRIRALDVRRLAAVRRWTVRMGTIYPDQWTEREIAVPPLKPGVYLVQANGGGAEKRTWFAVTDIALLAKRSRQELCLYAAHADSGRPLPGLDLTATDAKGRRTHGVTDTQGIWRVKQDPAQGNAWIFGSKEGSPAFLLSGAPAPPEPFTVYTVTDRPIYRPGHKVQYKSTLRERLEAEAPGGFVYRPYANRKVTVEIRDATDALLDRHEATTNAFGSLDGSFQLASEPTLGHWQIIVIPGEYRAYAQFEVQAYRKPEYTVGVRFDQSHYLGGSNIPVTIEARYYFGQPVADAAVQYNIAFQPEDSGPLAEGAAPEPPYAAQGVTDSHGQLMLQIQTQRLPLNRRMIVHATVTDLSRRSQQADANVLITAARFHLALSTDRGLYRPGEQMTVIVHAADYDGKPISTSVRVRLIEQKYDRLRRPYLETTTRDTHTDAMGNGSAVFTPPRPGYLRLEAQAFDADNNKTMITDYVWIAGEDVEDYTYPTLDLVPERSIYRPGETATILLNTSLITPKNREEGRGKREAGNKAKSKGEGVGKTQKFPVAWALLTIEGERLYRAEVVPLTSRSTVLHVPLSVNYFPSVAVKISILQDKQIYEQEVRLEVAREQQKLTVSVVADKDHYAPGETATYHVTTRDYLGAPAPAELALGVVDASIYAVMPDTTPEIEASFYGGQDVRVQTDFSFAAQYSGGAFQTAPHAPALAPPAPPGKPEIRVRRQFADTAYWNAFVLTDGNGTATVSFTLPDNLTTWRATARGITAATAVGAASQDVVSTMPLLVRLELPRFYVDGDQAVVSAIVHNYTGAERQVHAHIEATGADLEGDADHTLTLAAGSEQRLDWKAKIGHERQTTTAVSIQNPSVRFLVTADGGAGAQDAMELTLPVTPDGLKMVQASNNWLGGQAAEMSQAISEIPPGATVTLTLSPSIGAAMFEALDYLQSYPYGCAEQTMSSFLPDVIVAQALHRLNVRRNVRPDLDRWVNLGLQKLYRYQHTDGGWHWWEFDQTDGDMTAYVLWGLVQAKEAGYLVDEQRILRGTEALLRLLESEREDNRRVDWLLALAYARPERIAVGDKASPRAPLEAAYANRAHLDTYGLASLCLALAKVGGKYAPMATTVAGELDAKAVTKGTAMFWPAEVGGYTWRSDDVEVTAHVLRALLAVAPDDYRIEWGVRWLMGNRSGKAWTSTRSSAEAVFALAQYMEHNKELQPAFKARVMLDDRVVRDLAVTPDDVFAPPTTLTFTPEDLRGHTILKVDKTGAGTLYALLTFTYTIPAAEAKPMNKGIEVRRTFHLTAEDPSRAGSVPSGQELEVEVEVTADADYRYALLEEPIPAGCEVEPVADEREYRGFTWFEGGMGGYVRQEVRDDKVVFFFDDLPKGRTRVTYRLHAETPGVYRVLPTVASLVYFPEVRGNSGPVSARIDENKSVPR